MRTSQKLSAITATVLLAALAGASSASAASSWWHLTSGVRPTSIQPHQAQDEVLQVTVSATSGKFALVKEFTAGDEEDRRFAWNATAAVVQAGLEEMYGKGNVEVKGGPGNEEGTKPYLITFTGELADRNIYAASELNTQVVEFAKRDSENGSTAGKGLGIFPGSTEEEFLNCTGATGGGCKEAETISVVTKGRPDGYVVVDASNLGYGNVNGEARPFTFADKLPAGLHAVSIEATAPLAESNSYKEANYYKGVFGKCQLLSISCTFAGALNPYSQVEMIIGVDVDGAATGQLESEASVTGGETPPVSIKRPIDVGTAPPSFGVERYELMPEEAGGAPDTQAGSHPFQLTTTLGLNQTLEAEPVALAKDLRFNLPAGLIGNPNAIPQCTQSQFLTQNGAELSTLFFENECPPQTAIGIATVTVRENSLAVLAGHGAATLVTLTVPVFNLEPSPGEPARFGFWADARVYLDTSVRTGGNYGVTVSVDDIPQSVGFLKSEVTLWGVPGDRRHDNQRSLECLSAAFFPNERAPCKKLEASNPPPFLALPTSCTGPMQTSVEADSWAQTGDFGTFPGEQMAALDGCNRLQFDPSISVAPDGQAGSTPTGLKVGVHVPQGLTTDATGLAESDVKTISVTLPQGVALNPAGADGLQACGESQIGFTGVEAGGLDLFTPTLPEAFCPDAAKIGTAKITTPLLPNPLEGAVYLASPAPQGEAGQNPFDSLIAMYIVAQDPVSGTLVKLPGSASLNPQTGQVTATFDNSPQLPFETAELHFFGGERAPLATPAHCGTYTTAASFAPWSGSEAANSTSSFDITSGPNGGACPGAALPFSPALTAGTTNIQAGAFSPFTMTMSREDGQQSLKSVELHMPPGLSGVLTGIPLCGEAQADAGTCPAASLIGETTVAVGLGGDPYTVKGGQVFLTAGYGGAPFGLSIVNPAVAGPFNLGKVIVRAKLEVNPITTAVTVTSDSSGPYAIPPSIDGIPLQIKHVNVTIDRAGGFTFNPTNCGAREITGNLQSVEGAAATLKVPFQATNCATLGFAPKFAVSTGGKTSKAKGASLTVKLTYPKAPFGSEANIARVKVDLPKQLPSRLTTLQKACTNAQFEANPAGCPAASIIGHAKATTPLIPVPLEGPAYFVSHGGEAFPSLILVLQGYGVKLDLIGTTFISHAGITSSTFKTVPDAPVGSFELTLPTGKYSALAANLPAKANHSFCGQTLKMPTEFLAQNGAKINESTKISVTGCKKAVKKKRSSTKKAKKKS